jgi:C4-dicarboxylate-specific signal transduction histidine kinase
MESREEFLSMDGGACDDRSWSVTASVPYHLALRQRVDHARFVALRAVARVGAVALVMRTLHCCQVARVDANADTELHVTVDG